jgi:hypothetical protein
MLGLLVHRGTIPFETGEQLIGGLVLGSWRRLRKTVETTRTALQWPTYMEWFQWLAEQFEKRERLQQVPAHIRWRDWDLSRY